MNKAAHKAVNKAKKVIRQVKLQTILGATTSVHGHLEFVDGLHLEGQVVGDVISHQDNAVLFVMPQACIRGTVAVSHIVVEGTIQGDIHTHYIELAAQAKVTGNVYYHLLELAMGAEVNGNLVRQEPAADGTYPPVKAPMAVPESAPVAASEPDPVVTVTQTKEF